MKRITPFLIAAMAICGYLAAPSARAQEPAPGQTYHLVKIQFVGLQRLKPEEAIAASGLTVGQTTDAAALDAAAGTLAESGLFQTLTYNLHVTKDQEATVTFTVVEATVRLPVKFDNFIWFTDEELFAAVRKEVPVYDGSAPESGATVDGIKRALMNLLRQKKISGSVDFAPTTDVHQKLTGLAFQFHGDALNVCSVNFPGAAQIEESLLERKAQELLGKEYSREFIAGFAQETLVPLYRKLGLLKVAFAVAQGRPGTGEQCHDGVAVAVPVDEGTIYHWSNADWSGNAVFEGPELNHALDMRTGEVADGLKIDAGFELVRHAYGKKGYIDARLVPTPEFDDDKKTVGYHVSVVEGPQFLMGNFNITGLPAEETARLRAQWKLQPGDVFDDSYVKEFIKTVIVPDQALAALIHKDNLTKLDTSVKPDRDKRTVAVTISFARP